jgi:hypothetical protein
MTDEEKIPGTRVPDTPIHRASMWLEYLKFRERRKDATAPEDMDDATWETFVAATGANFTVEQMQEAAAYYGQNMLQMMLGGRVDFAIPSPTGKGHISGRSAFASLWLDAFMHGYATARGKRGMSNLEAELVGTIPDGMEYGCEDCTYHTADEQDALLHCDVEKHSLALRPL